LNISKIILYDEPAVPELEIDTLQRFLSDTFHINTTVRSSPFNNIDNKTIEKIASCRVFNLESPFKESKPTDEQLEFERMYCNDTKFMEKLPTPETAEKISDLVMYDGFEIRNVLENMIPKEDGCFNIIFTNKMTCTYDYSDLRYHGRAVICSNPSIISTSGLVEAPAKPRQYYFDAMKAKSQGDDLESVKKKYENEFLEYHDKRTSKIIEGYMLQAVFYYLTGDPFCENLDCRLNNAHWQKDLLYSQLKFGKLCEKHQLTLEKLHL
jgi:hypothetical protein